MNYLLFSLLYILSTNTFASVDLDKHYYPSNQFKNECHILYYSMREKSIPVSIKRSTVLINSTRNTSKKLHSERLTLCVECDDSSLDSYSSVYHSGTDSYYTPDMANSLELTEPLFEGFLDIPRVRECFTNSKVGKGKFKHRRLFEDNACLKEEIFNFTAKKMKLTNYEVNLMKKNKKMNFNDFYKDCRKAMTDDESVMTSIFGYFLDTKFDVNFSVESELKKSISNKMRNGVKRSDFFKSTQPYSTDQAGAIQD